MARKTLLACGFIASMLYIAMNTFVPMWWHAYNSFSQTISELSAIDAPTRPIWVPLGILYTLLVAAFGVGVWQSAQRNRRLRVVGGLFVASGLIGLGWLPMHQRAVLAAGGGTLTDTMHIVWSVVTVLLVMFQLGFSAAAFGRRFRVYTVVTMVVLFFFGALTFRSAPVLPPISRRRGSVCGSASTCWDSWSGRQCSRWVCCLVKPTSAALNAQ